MKKLFIIITFLLLAGNLFAYPVKSSFSKITKFDDTTYYWNFEATTPIELSSKNWNDWVSEMTEMGYVSTAVRVIPLDEALENHTGPIAEVLLARSYGYYNVCASWENNLYILNTNYFVSEQSILLITFTLTK